MGTEESHKKIDPKQHKQNKDESYLKTKSLQNPSVFLDCLPCLYRVLWDGILYVSEDVIAVWSGLVM